MADPQEHPSSPALDPAGQPHRGGTDAVEMAAANLRAALALLAALQHSGLRQVVVCPGSRSAPLAVAAALLERVGLGLHTALDERSAAFFALAFGRATGLPAAVITTSGSAVAHLLCACVEADHGAIPLLLLTADRPTRLKGCGANQSVNQEDFLRPSCRWLGTAAGDGLAGMGAEALAALAQGALAACLGEPGRSPAGAVHLNLPFEEPLHAEVATIVAFEEALQEALAGRPGALERLGLDSPVALVALGPPRDLEPAEPPPQGEFAALSEERQPAQGPLQRLGSQAFAFAAAEAPAASTGAVQKDPVAQQHQPAEAIRLDPDRPGVVVAGPWRGHPGRWRAHLEALDRWQRRSGWPLLADPLSGLRGLPGLESVAGYDLLLEDPPPCLAAGQVLRLGPLPASRRLQRWLAELGGRQLLLSDSDPRPLDPLRLAAAQLPCGLEGWLATLGPLGEGPPTAEALHHRRQWQSAESRLQAFLDRELNGSSDPGAHCWSEPVLARQLSRLLPPGLPLMLANSSPVRDWESFADPAAPPRPVYGFRGASGIDGTLSEACGLAEALGACVLLSGDLALLHDSNGWLWRPQLRGRLTVVLIDNGGGGIFEQLPIRCGDQGPLDFERLFAMPQPLDPLALAALHGVPARRLAGPADLPQALEWGLAQPFSLLLLNTDRRRDAELRRRLRTMAAQMFAP